VRSCRKDLLFLLYLKGSELNTAQFRVRLSISRVQETGKDLDLLGGRQIAIPFPHFVSIQFQLEPIFGASSTGLAGAIVPKEMVPSELHALFVGVLESKKNVLLVDIVLVIVTLSVFVGNLNTLVAFQALPGTRPFQLDRFRMILVFFVSLLCGPEERK
jgi:hypothetical protein